MKIKSPIFQDGGAIPTQGGEAAPAQGAPQEGGQQDPLAMLVQMAQQALQSQDHQAAFAVCDGLIKLVQQMMQQQGGGGEQAAAPQGEPVYARGGKLVRRA